MRLDRAQLAAATAVCGDVYRAFREACQACHNAAMRSADVVVIGGGVNGASAAFNLASLGVKRITLVERRHLAAGASGKSGSLVRMHYTNDAEARLAFESLKVFRDFSRIVGGDCGFQPIGFVQVVAPGYEKALHANVAMQQRLGIETQPISRDELGRLVPAMRVDDIGAACWEPGSGSADPNATTFGFAEVARRLGAPIEIVFFNVPAATE